MFEKEIKFISDFCLNQVKYLGQQFTFEKILTTELHPAIVQYISAELDFMIYADRRKLLQQSFFDYTGREISDHFKKISEEIKRTKIISIEDVRKLILQAVSFNANYVVRPKWSLTKLIYHDQSTISVDELEIMLSYIFYYDYIKNVLTAYLVKRKVVQLSLSEFDLILNRIDRELFKSNTDQLIDNALNSIGDFFNIGGTDKTLVSPTAIEILLKEKNLLDLMMKLRKGVPETAKKNLKINGIKRILYPEGTTEQDLTNKPGDEIKEGDQKTSDESNPLEQKKPDSSQTEEEQSALGGEQLEKTSLSELEEIDKTLGELAEMHAEELEKANVEEFLSPDEERTLIALYEEGLHDAKESSPAETESIEDNKTFEIPEEVQTDEVESEPQLEEERLLNETPEAASEEVQPPDITVNQEQEEIEFQEEETIITSSGLDEIPDSPVISQKEIVNEMLKDYFGESSESNETEAATEEQDKEEVITSQPRRIDTLEDELFEVFEELDKLDNSIVIEEELVEDEQTDSEILIEEGSAEDRPVENTTPSFKDELEEDLKTIDEIAFADEEIEIEKVPQVEVLKTETSKLPDVTSAEAQLKNDVKESSVFPEKISATTRKREQVSPSPITSARKTRKKDLFSYLKSKEIQKIISNIFGNDEDDFVNTTEKIVECASYKEASDILKSVFTSYKISPYSKEAVNLANAVSNYFRQA